MLYGVCTGWRDRKRLRSVREAGADYVEFSFSSFAETSRDEVEDLSGFLRQIGLPCLAYNVMIPASLRITGPRRDPAAAAAFVEQNLEKLTPLDARTVVFGSCAARRCEEGEDPREAMEQLAHFTADLLVPALRRHGYVCAVESLSECNLIHTVEDSLSLLRRVGAEEAQLLLDFYHIHVNGEGLPSFPRRQGFLRHVHTASPGNERSFPAPDDGDFAVYVRDFAFLHRIGYDGTVSLEGREPEESQYTVRLRTALDTLRAADAAARAQRPAP